MQRHMAYQQYAPAPAPAATATPHRYSGTSSAFSPSANPNEDWTKISDLAERRRIQNRIAQRNYRKKLKKRLEDLERRAGSSSASPEQKPAELQQQQQQQQRQQQRKPQQQPIRSPRQEFPSPPSSDSEFRHHTPELPGQQFVSVSVPEERNMFMHQHTRQLSTSPPPFSYSTYPAPMTYSNTPYHTAPTTLTQELPSYAPYLPPPSSTYPPTTLPSLVHPPKPEYFHDDDLHHEMGPYGSGYPLMSAGIEIPPPHAYPESDAHTPPLCDSFEPSQAGSPPESGYPTTPNSLPRSPLLPALHMM